MCHVEGRERVRRMALGNFCRDGVKRANVYQSCCAQAMQVQVFFFSLLFLFRGYSGREYLTQ